MISYPISTMTCSFNFHKQEIVLSFISLSQPQQSCGVLRKINLEKIDEQNGGKFRKIQNYVVKEKAGKTEIIYTPPKFPEVPKLMQDLVRWIDEAIKKDISSIIIAGIAHYELVSIHPFIDGNGRTARALATLILYKLGYDTKRLFSLEEYYYDQDLASYYSALQSGQKTGAVRI